MFDACTCLSTVGDRAFPVAAARLSNNLPPQNVTSSSSISVFEIRLKTNLSVVLFPNKCKKNLTV